MNTRFLTHRISALALMLTAGPALVAQVSTGSLVGSVKDKNGAPISGVRVTLSSPALFAPRVVQSDANGEWRAPLLAVGYYEVSVSKDGFVGSKSQNVRVGLGSSSRVDLTMKPVQAAGAVVEVVSGAAAGVDKADTKAGTNISADTLLVLPAASRGFGGAADLSPGLVTGSGGSYSIRGGATGNTQYRVNGTDVKDDYQGNLTGTFLIEDNVEDMQVVLSPLNARNGRATGGAINVVTKTGGNDFHGSIRADLSRNSWSAKNPGQVFYSPDGDLYTDDNLQRQYQVTLSGPIIKDRIWFSLGTILAPDNTANFDLSNPYGTRSNAPVQSRSTGANAIMNAGPAGYAWTALEVAAPYIRRDSRSYYEGKITAAVSADHTVEFSYTKEQTDLYNRNPYGDGGATISRLAALGHQNTEKEVFGLGYRGVLSSNTFIEARYNVLDSATYFPAGDLSFGQGELMIVYAGQTGSAGTRRGLSYPFGLGQPPHPDKRPNRSGNVNLKLFRDFFGGSHEIDMGVDYYEGRRDTATQSGTPNRVYRVGGIYESTTVANSFLFPTLLWQGYGSAYAMDITGLRGPAPTMVQYTSQDGLNKNQMLSLYANDQWTINQNWNFMLGVRYDSMKVIDTTGESLAKSGDFSPRMQVRYDPTGDAKHLFTFTAARYNGDFTTAFTDAFITQGTSNWMAYGWLGVNGVAQPAPGTAATIDPQRGVRFVTYDQLTAVNSYGPNPINAGNVRVQNLIDPDLRAPYMDELTLSYRRSWATGSFVSITGVHRVWKQEWAFAKDYDPTKWAVNIPGTATTLNPGGINVIATRIFNSDDLKREYNGIEMEWSSRINSIWTVGGNWTWSRLTGNQEGGDAFGSTFRDNTPPSYFSNRVVKEAMGMTQDEIAPYGALGNNVTNRARLHVSAVLPLGKGTISYSAMLRYTSGRNYSQVVNDPYAAGTFTSMATPSEQAPAQYTAFVGGRGQFGGNDTYGVDFKLNYQVPLGIKKLMLIGDVTVSNLFNHSCTSGLENGTWADAKYTLDPYTGAGYIYGVKNRAVVINDGSTWGSTNKRDSYGDLRNDTAYYQAPRSVAMSIGLKF